MSTLDGFQKARNEYKCSWEVGNDFDLAILLQPHSDLVDVHVDIDIYGEDCNSIFTRYLSKHGMNAVVSDFIACLSPLEKSRSDRADWLRVSLAQMFDVRVEDVLETFADMQSVRATITALGKSIYEWRKD